MKEKLIAEFIEKSVLGFLFLILFVCFLILFYIYFKNNNKNSKDKFWKEVFTFLDKNKDRLACMSGWDLRYNSTVIGLYADSINFIQKYADAMIDPEYLITRTHFVVKGKMKGPYDNTNHKEGDIVEISMRHSW